MQRPKHSSYHIVSLYSGGYNLKAGAGSMIELMKFDMGGAAATLGAARIIADTQPTGVEVGVGLGQHACGTAVHLSSLVDAQILWVYLV